MDSQKEFNQVIRQLVANRANLPTEQLNKLSGSIDSWLSSPQLIKASSMTEQDIENKLQWIRERQSNKLQAKPGEQTAMEVKYLVADALIDTLPAYKTKDKSEENSNNDRMLNHTSSWIANKLSADDSDDILGKCDEDLGELVIWRQLVENCKQISAIVDEVFESAGEMARSESSSISAEDIMPSMLRDERKNVEQEIHPDLEKIVPSTWSSLDMGEDNTSSSPWDPALLVLGILLAIAFVWAFNVSTSNYQNSSSANITSQMKDLSAERVQTLSDGSIFSMLSNHHQLNKPVVLKLIKESATRNKTELLPALVSVSNSESPVVRAEVVRALFSNNYIASDETIIIGNKLLSDPDFLVRGYASKLLGKVNDERAMFILKKRLEKEKDLAVISVIKKQLAQK